MSKASFRLVCVGTYSECSTTFPKSNRLEILPSSTSPGSTFRSSPSTTSPPGSTYNAVRLLPCRARRLHGHRDDLPRLRRTSSPLLVHHRQVSPNERDVTSVVASILPRPRRRPLASREPRLRKRGPTLTDRRSRRPSLGPRRNARPALARCQSPQ